MKELIISAMLVIIILVFFVFFIFRNVIDRLNRNSKKYFIDKLQDYDDVINLKKQELQSLDKQLEKVQAQRDKLLEENPNLLIEFNLQADNKQQEKNVDKKTEEEVMFNMPNPQYREEAFFNTYRSLKQQFKVNSEKVVKDFLKEHTNKQEQKEYETLMKFRNYFDSDTIYQCLTLTKQEQYDVIDSVTKKKQKQVLGFDEYTDANFDLMKFLETIDNRIKQIDPTIYVYVGRKEENYDYLSEYIKTDTYKNMIEGVIISYQGKIYDYSI